MVFAKKVQVVQWTESVFLTINNVGYVIICFAT